MDLLYRDRSERGKVRLAGPQRAWFLHQILTQAFEDIAPGEARDAAMITAHGRMTGYLEVVATDDALLAHHEPALAPGLAEEIRRYVFATQVTVDDVTEELGLVLLVGDDWRAMAEEHAPDGVLHRSRSLGVPAGYLWMERGAVRETLARLDAAGARQASEGDLERIRIEHGVPRWGKEMDAKTFPQEAGIDAWAVHYDKGCYLGQEAMAKIHFRGKVNRRLAQLRGDALREGATIVSDGAQVGRVTSAADGVALALVKNGVEPGTDVDVDGHRVKVVA